MPHGSGSTRRSRFIGNDAYTLEHVRADLDRFEFLLGDDGERPSATPES